MNPRIQTGKGVSGCIRYARGQGRDPKTGLVKDLAPGEKSRVEWFAGTGFGFEIASDADLELARRMMEFAALNQASRTKKCEQDCVHLSLSWSPGENPTREQMEAAAHSALAALGMGNAMALFFAHADEDYKHVHIVASKINPDTGRAYDLAGSWRTLSSWAEQYERENGGIISTRRQTANELRGAIARRDAEGVLEALTKQRATFTAEQLERALQKEIHLKPGATAEQKHGNAEERAEFARAILTHASVVALADQKDGPTTRYTTRAVLEAESYVLRAAEGLIADNRHQLDERQRFAALNTSRYEGISREQAQAFRHACGAEGLALIDGQAGTGKSFAMAAIRDAYAAAGYRVIGLAPTNKVARAMSEDGFAHAKTIHSELFALNNARTSWNDRTLVMVDEAAMIDTRLMAMLQAHASAAGAKLILVGDDRQLSSIDFGGMYTTLKDRYGAAELTEVRRQRKNDDRRASEMLAEGNFDGALGIYEQQGAIHWTRTQPEARAELVEQWAKDTESDPDKARFVFAYTNEDVNRLNAALRAVRKDRGELGPDQMIETAHGRTNFAVGDRIQFTGTDKKAGIDNGQPATIEAIDGAFLAVKLAGRESKTINFNAAAFNKFRHGYAGTIYKGQGDTLDETYLYHSEHWRSAPSYVALTRHREKTAVFAARNTARYIGELARQMARPDERRAASMFHHNEEIGPAQILSPAEVLAAIAPDFGPAASAPAVRTPIELKAATPHHSGSNADSPIDDAGQPAGGIIGAFTRMTKIIGGLLGRANGTEDERSRDAPGKESVEAAAASASAELAGRGGEGAEKDPYLAALLAASDVELNPDEQEPEREPVRRRAQRRGRSL
jgi:Ti-type conjugative transfer relaxase TraA